MENALSQLSLLPETREEQRIFVHKAIEELMNGGYDIMKFWIQASILADTLNEIKDSLVIKRAAIAEADKYKDQPFMGCKIGVSKSKSYNFRDCNYMEWVVAKADLEDAKERVKEAEVFLKSLKKQVADPETGLLIEPPTFTETEYITVK